MTHRGDSAKKEADIEQQMVTAVCPLGLNQICHLTGHRLVTVSESRDSKGTVYHTSAVLSPNEPTTSSSVDAISVDGRTSAGSGSRFPDIGRCSLAALARHGKKFVAVALRGQIWFAELGHHPSSEVGFLIFLLSTDLYC